MKKKKKKFVKHLNLIENIFKKLVEVNKKILPKFDPKMKWTEFKCDKIRPLTEKQLEEIVLLKNDDAADLTKLLDCGLFVKDSAGSLYPDSNLRLYSFYMKEKGQFMEYKEWLSDKIFTKENFLFKL